MGRRPGVVSEGAAATLVVRRTRQRRTIDHVAQTQVLVSTLLKALATQVRKVNAQGVAERKMANVCFYSPR
jgi:hypothetical protein